MGKIIEELEEYGAKTLSLTSGLLSENIDQWLDEKRLEIILQDDDKTYTLKASHYVGLIPISNDLILRIRPKRSPDGTYFELQMLEDCLKMPELIRRIFPENKKPLFEWLYDAEPIEIKGQQQARAAILFLIVTFLKELKVLCKRHLRGKFPRIRRNLNGKVKGRINIKHHFKDNVVKGRADRIYCDFNVHSIDVIENRILKAALERSKTYLRFSKTGFIDASTPISHIWELINECSNYLSSVRLTRIYPSDFHGLVFSGLMKPYKMPIVLAKNILNLLGFNPDSDGPKRDWSVRFYPYIMDMNLLFEYYCELMLREKREELTIQPKALWPGEYNLSDNGGVWVRPDFLFIDGDNRPVIADAKYKYNWPQKIKDENESCRPDIYQVVAYSCHKGVHKKLISLLELNGKSNSEIDRKKLKIFIFYPKSSPSQYEKTHFIDGFDVGEFKAISVPMPWDKQN